MKPHTMKCFAFIGIVLFLGMVIAPSINAGIVINPSNNKMSFKDENIFCFIIAKVSNSRSFKNSLVFDKYYRQIRSIGPHVNSFLCFGDYFWNTDGYVDNNPARGFVKTYGLSGEKTWEGNSLWGNLHTVYETGGIGMSQWHEYYYLGANHFTGIMIPSIWTQDGKLVLGDLIIGRAIRVSITYDCPE